MKIVGLTGGIGMGKSTVARLLRQRRLLVFDADAEVHRLQAPGGAALPAIGAAFPGTVVDGRLDRARLRAAVLGDAAALRRLEAIIHPLVRAGEQRFVARARRAGAGCVVLDIPLLFETGGDRRVDAVWVVSAPAAVQRARVRARGGLGEAQIDAILARQMPDALKRRRADAVIPTGLSRRHAQARVIRILDGMRRKV